MTSSPLEILCGDRGEPGKACILKADHDGGHDRRPILVSASHVIEGLLELRGDFTRAAARLEQLLESLSDAMGGCLHPVDKRVEQATFKWPQRFKCAECGQTMNGPELGRKVAG